LFFHVIPRRLATFCTRIKYNNNNNNNNKFIAPLRVTISYTITPNNTIYTIYALLHLLTAIRAPFLALHAAILNQSLNPIKSRPRTSPPPPSTRGTPSVTESTHTRTRNRWWTSVSSCFSVHFAFLITVLFSLPSLRVYSSVTLHSLFFLSLSLHFSHPPFPLPLLSQYPLYFLLPASPLPLSPCPTPFPYVFPGFSLPPT